jgi:hypothetical protein
MVCSDMCSFRRFPLSTALVISALSFSYDDTATRAASTEFVQGKLRMVIGISYAHRLAVGGKTFPAFDDVMVNQHGFGHAVHSKKEVMYFL